MNRCRSIRTGLYESLVKIAQRNENYLEEAHKQQHTTQSNYNAYLPLSSHSQLYGILICLCYMCLKEIYGV
jgi:hypothetical protein